MDRAGLNRAGLDRAGLKSTPRAYHAPRAARSRGAGRGGLWEPEDRNVCIGIAISDFQRDGRETLPDREIETGVKLDFIGPDVGPHSRNAVRQQAAVAQDLRRQDRRRPIQVHEITGRPASRLALASSNSAADGARQKRAARLRCESSRASPRACDPKTQAASTPKSRSRRATICSIPSCMAPSRLHRTNAAPKRRGVSLEPEGAVAELADEA